MRFNVDQLRDALKLLKPVTRSNKHYEPWKRVLVSYDGNYETTISATNGDVWMVNHISANAESEPITLFLDLVELEEAIKHMDFNVYLTKSETDDEVVLVSDSVGTRSTQITNYHADDFAPVPDAKPDDTSGLLFQLTQKHWIALRERVMPYAASRTIAVPCSRVSTSRTSSGTCSPPQRMDSVWRTTTSRMRCRSSIRSCFACPTSRCCPPSLRVSASTGWAPRASTSSSSSVTSGPRRAAPSTSRWSIRTLDGTFPDYRQIIPKPETLNGELHGSGVADRGSRQGEGWERVPTQVQDGGALTVRPDNRKVSQKMNWVNPGITFHGELEDLAINPQYLNDAAQQLKSGNLVTIKTTEKRGGHCYISDGAGQVVIMPMELPPEGVRRRF